MNECPAPRNDLLGSRWATWLLWIGPWALIIGSSNTANTTHTILWTGCFALSGAACLVNARRCGRRHCFYTGPLFLLAALASLLQGMGILPLGLNGWNWILCFAIAGTLLACCGLEAWLGKYRTGCSPRA
jgi:CDP-diglyceride synthetase